MYKYGIKGSCVTERYELKFFGYMRGVEKADGAKYVVVKGVVVSNGVARDVVARNVVARDVVERHVDVNKLWWPGLCLLGMWL